MHEGEDEWASSGNLTQQHTNLGMDIISVMVIGAYSITTFYRIHFPIILIPSDDYGERYIT